MRKETALAIIAGISIGLITAFGIWRVTTAIKKNAVEIKGTNTPIADLKKDFSFTIANLSDFDVITENPKTIKGITKPLSKIIVSTSDEDFMGISIEDGSFEVDVTFPAGLSLIKTASFDTDGNTSETNFKIVYSSEFEKYVDPAKKSRAYVGTVTDISEGTIQIKAGNGEILQAGVSEETTYINLLKKSAVVKNTDLAIGDYIVAMGLINGNKVLSTKRILITSELIDDKRQIVWGKIAELSKKELIITKNNGEALKISVPKTWNGPDIDELGENQIIIISNELVGETYTLRSIFTPVE